MDQSLRKMIVIDREKAEQPIVGPTRIRYVCVGNVCLKFQRIAPGDGLARGDITRPCREAFTKMGVVARKATLFRQPPPRHVALAQCLAFNPLRQVNVDT